MFEYLAKLVKLFWEKAILLFSRVNQDYYNPFRLDKRLIESLDKEFIYATQNYWKSYTRNGKKP